MKKWFASFSERSLPQQAEFMCTWGTAVLGVLLLFQILVLPVQLLLLALLVGVLVIAGAGWGKKGLRVLGRILSLLLPAGVLVLFLVDAILSAGLGVSAEGFLLYICVFCAPLLCYHLPGFFTLAEKACRYDVWAYRVIYTLYLVVVGTCCFAKVVTRDIAWLWDVEVLRFIWLGAGVAGYVCSWLNHRKGPVADKT